MEPRFQPNEIGHESGDESGGWPQEETRPAGKIEQSRTLFCLQRLKAVTKMPQIRYGIGRLRGVFSGMRVKLKRQRLLEALSQSSLTQNHWAMKLGLSRGHFSEVVNGKHPYVSPRTREKLLEGLGIPFDELFEV